MLQLPLVKAPDVAVVWFTACDLRTHDHDALVAVAGAAGAVPLYVFDDQAGAAIFIASKYFIGYSSRAQLHAEYGDILAV